ncbi:hypothetical protein cyc_04845 [Cyclospora cayetanensis]|uniref:Transmembrane protein n=1 Tax=Cyclospora cayetanensis TaxID=88456 RepID=A0A1D3CY58_9EIME|nr:hypothetical protein cyc_04845 [Cyclospora cayetanensis]
MLPCGLVGAVFYTFLPILCNATGDIAATLAWGRSFISESRSPMDQQFSETFTETFYGDYWRAAFRGPASHDSWPFSRVGKRPNVFSFRANNEIRGVYEEKTRGVSSRRGQSGARKFCSAVCLTVLAMIAFSSTWALILSRLNPPSERQLDEESDTILGTFKEEQDPARGEQSPPEKVAPTVPTGQPQITPVPPGAPLMRGLSLQERQKQIDTVEPPSPTAGMLKPTVHVEQSRVTPVGSEDATLVETSVQETLQKLETLKQVLLAAEDIVRAIDTEEAWKTLEALKRRVKEDLEKLSSLKDIPTTDTEGIRSKTMVLNEKFLMSIVSDVTPLLQSLQKEAQEFARRVARKMLKLQPVERFSAAEAEVLKGITSETLANSLIYYAPSLNTWKIFSEGAREAEQRVAKVPLFAGIDDSFQLEKVAADCVFLAEMKSVLTHTQASLDNLHRISIGATRSRHCQRLQTLSIGLRGSCRLMEAIVKQAKDVLPPHAVVEDREVLENVSNKLDKVKEALAKLSMETESVHTAESIEAIDNQGFSATLVGKEAESLLVEASEELSRVSYMTGFSSASALESTVLSLIDDAVESAENSNLEVKEVCQGLRTNIENSSKKNTEHFVNPRIWQVLQQAVQRLEDQAASLASRAKSVSQHARTNTSLLSLSTLHQNALTTVAQLNELLSQEHLLQVHYEVLTRLERGMQLSDSVAKAAVKQSGDPFRHCPNVVERWAKQMLIISTGKRACGTFPQLAVAFEGGKRLATSFNQRVGLSCPLTTACTVREGVQALVEMTFREVMVR